jgi:hypothetical protein
MLLQLTASIAAGKYVPPNITLKGSEIVLALKMGHLREEVLE